MKTIAQMSHDRMWHKVHSDLADMSADNFGQDLPEIRLMVAILTLAGEDRDMSYIKSQNFEDLCYNVKLHKAFVQNAFKRAWRIQDSAQVWIPTPELIEEDL